MVLKENWLCIALYLTELFSITREKQTNRNGLKAGGYGFNLRLDVMFRWDQGDRNAFWFLSCLSWPWFDVSHDDIFITIALSALYALDHQV